MIPNELKVEQKPELSNPVLLLGFSGWMNGGQVSTGTVEYLIEKFQAHMLASGTFAVNPSCYARSIPPV